MFIYCNLVVLFGAVLIFSGQVHAGEIIGGHEAVAHSRPYMVLLEMRTYEDTTAYCGGVLVSEDFVLTAAHCQAKFYNVIIGLHSFYENKKMNVSVDQEFVHKDYDEKEYRNDIMLLKLSTNVSFDKKQEPIALAKKKDELPKSCLVIGWGQTSRDTTWMSPNLMEVNVTLTANDLCDDKYLYCSEGEKGPGQGDSGGPLVCEDGKAYGVVSADRKLDSGCMLYSYTKIPHYRGWICNIMKCK